MRVDAIAEEHAASRLQATVIGDISINERMNWDDESWLVLMGSERIRDCLSARPSRTCRFLSSRAHRPQLATFANSMESNRIHIQPPSHSNTVEAETTSSTVPSSFSP